jgi:hypothetical protein
MKTIVLILMVISAIALILAVLMGLNIIKTAIMNITGRDLVALSTACSMYAIGIHLTKPFEKGGTSA